MDTQEKTNYDKQAIIRELMGDDEDKLFETLENFSEMLMRYNSAIREIRTKFEVLNDDLSLRNSRNPIESISFRIKKPISIAKKLKRMGYPVTEIDLAWFLQFQILSYKPPGKNQLQTQ